MSWSNVVYNGKYACFSSITDSFLTEFMEKDEYELWRKAHYRSDEYIPIEQCATKTINEATLSISLNRTAEELLLCLKSSSGLSETECKDIIYNMQTEYYCPTKMKDGTFICPNCKQKLKIGQPICSNGDCYMDLIWR